MPLECYVQLARGVNSSYSERRPRVFPLTMRLVDAVPVCIPCVDRTYGRVSISQVRSIHTDSVVAVRNANRPWKTCTCFPTDGSPVGFHP